MFCEADLWIGLSHRLGLNKGGGSHFMVSMAWGLILGMCFGLRYRPGMGFEIEFVTAFEVLGMDLGLRVRCALVLLLVMGFQGTVTLGLIWGPVFKNSTWGWRLGYVWKRVID